MSVNKCILVGNVGKDPEVRYLDSGKAVANITIATSERGYTLANGTQVPERTEWHNVILWGPLAEIAEKYVKKGSQLYIEGKITTRKWEKDGITRYNTDIVASEMQMLGKKPESGAYNPEELTYTAQQPQPDRSAQKSDFANSDGGEEKDDLPF